VPCVCLTRLGIVVDSLYVCINGKSICYCAQWLVSYIMFLSFKISACLFYPFLSPLLHYIRRCLVKIDLATYPLSFTLSSLLLSFVFHVLKPSKMANTKIMAIKNPSHSSTSDSENIPSPSPSTHKHKGKGKAIEVSSRSNSKETMTVTPPSFQGCCDKFTKEEELYESKEVWTKEKEATI